MEMRVHLRKTCHGWERVVLRDGALIPCDLVEWCAHIVGTSVTITRDQREDVRSKIAIVRR